MEANQRQNNEKKTLIAIILTVITMAAEIIFGYLTHSMALLADGFHMGTHAFALTLTFIAYVLIRKFSDSKYFPKGTEKIGTLSAYTSSLFLGATGIWIVIESINRFLHPLNIQFREAIIVAFIGLIVNAACIYVMENNHDHNSHHHHEHHDKEEEEEEEKDYNYKAAYYHILADILTSILAIFALFAGKYFNITYLDSIIGILGGILIIKWAISLIKDTVVELIDMEI